MQPSALLERLNAFAREFDSTFGLVLADAPGVPQNLRDAVTYAALAPGKRLRPYLVVRCSEIANESNLLTWAAAMSIECIHAFSLVHDDLPAMDNDDLRCGLPTCHRKFGEATAILAGDALVVLAFQLLSVTPGDKDARIACIEELSRSAGWAGMIGGQMSDIEGESKPPDRSLVDYIHERKTAKLFYAACRMGAFAGGASDSQTLSLALYGESLGKAFQIADDLLDVTATSAEIGKAAGKDAHRCKQTWPRCVGIEESRHAADRLAEQALSFLSDWGAEADDLRALARFAVDRKN